MGLVRGLWDAKLDVQMTEFGRATPSLWQEYEMPANETAAIIGLGYVGLPLAQAALRARLRVVGFDINEGLITNLKAGRSPISDISDDGIQEMIAAGFEPTADASRLAGCSIFVICVPTPLSDEGGPDLTAVISAAASLVPHLKAGDLVILESTTYPGTTEEILGPILARSGLSVPRDVKLAFSPERVDPGNEQYGITNTPKIVGGVDSGSSQAAESFYGKFCETVVVAKGAREAELAKLLENTYRHVNIALVNELAQLSHELGVDVWDAIRCAATKPFGFHAFYPGPGVGGHCIPIDPNYLSHHVRSTLGHSFRFIELAQDINALMPTYVCRRLQDLLNDLGKPVNGSRILILWVTYKANVADSRETPAEPIAVTLRGLGAELSFWDPYVPSWHVEELAVSRVGNLEAAIDRGDFDVALLLQRHRGLDLDHLQRSGLAVFDTRAVMPVSDSVVRL